MIFHKIQFYRTSLSTRTLHGRLKWKSKKFINFMQVAIPKIDKIFFKIEIWLYIIYDYLPLERYTWSNILASHLWEPLWPGPNACTCKGKGEQCKQPLLVSDNSCEQTLPVNCCNSSERASEQVTRRNADGNDVDDRLPIMAQVACIQLWDEKSCIWKQRYCHIIKKGQGWEGIHLLAPVSLSLFASVFFPRVNSCTHQ